MSKTLSVTRGLNFFKVYFPPGSTMSFFLSLHSSSFGFFIPFRTPSDPSFSFGSFGAQGLTRADDRGGRADLRGLPGFRYSVVCRARRNKKASCCCTRLSDYLIHFYPSERSISLSFSRSSGLVGNNRTLCYSHSIVPVGFGVRS